MKILHTADWHIGKKLHKQELSEDFDLFVDWLCAVIDQHQIDVLLVSGDIFDLANPSSEARRQYYQTLIRLRRTRCKIILTGGNHDSPGMLNAPKEILRELDIHILGGLPSSLEEALIPVYDGKQEPSLIIAALPFLRDSDLRAATDGFDYDDRLETVRQGIQQIFLRSAEICAEKFPGIPALAMGHLFTAGIETSESERDIQIGNQAAFSASGFGAYFNYIALGHIHKPQQVSAEIPIYYSGSPLPLSFSERRDAKRVLLLDTQASWTPESIAVPCFRSLIRISGPLEQLRLKLSQLPSPSQLESLIEVSLIAEHYDAELIFELDQLVSNFEKPGYRIVKHRVHFEHRPEGAAAHFDPAHQLEDLNPKEVFLELLKNGSHQHGTPSEVLSAFEELLEEVQQDEKISSSA